MKRAISLSNPIRNLSNPTHKDLLKSYVARNRLTCIVLHPDHHCPSFWGWAEACPGAMSREYRYDLYTIHSANGSRRLGAQLREAQLPSWEDNRHRSYRYLSQSSLLLRKQNRTSSLFYLYHPNDAIVY